MGRACWLARGVVQGPWEVCGAVSSSETLQPMWCVTRKASDCSHEAWAQGAAFPPAALSLAMGPSFSGAPVSCCPDWGLLTY